MKRTPDTINWPDYLRLLAEFPETEDEGGRWLFGHGFLPERVDDGRVVDGGLAEGDAVVGAVFGIIVDLRGIQEGLGGDAAFVEADSSEGFLFKQDRGESGRSRTLGCHVSAGAAAYDR